MLKNFKKITAYILIFNLLVAASAYAIPTEAYHFYVRGLLASRAGDLKYALEQYQRVIMLDKNAVLAYRELAYLYWQFGRFNDSFYAAEKYNELAGDQVETQLFLGSFYLMTGQSALARKAWETALEIEPENETAILYLAAYYSDRYPEKAVIYWEKFIKQRPDSARGYYQLGASHEKLGHLEEAKDSFKKAVDLEPNEAEAHLSLAGIYEQKGETDAAIKEYEHYLEVVPDNLTVLLYLGGLYFRLNRFEESEKVFTRALELNPIDTNINFWLGILAEQRQDWRKAISHFELIREKNESSVVLTRLSFYYSAMKNVSRAIKYLKKVAEIEPDNPNSYYLLGLAYFDMKKYKSAEKNFLKAIELKPDFEEIYFHLGVLYDSWGRFDKAVSKFEKVISLNPENATALNYLGYSYADRNMKLDEAEDLINKALKIDPDNGAYIDSLGWVYFRRGSFKEAEEILNRAVGKIADPIVWEHLGDVRFKLDNTSQAWDAYQKAMELDPNNKILAKKISQLEKFVLPKTLHRKILKRAVGNLLQVKSLKTNFAISAKTPEYNYRSFGTFQYSRPDKWRIDILGNLFAPQIVIMENHDINVYPQAMNRNISVENLQYLSRIKDYFNADLLEQFDSEDTEVTVKGSDYLYKLGKKTLLIDKKIGMIKEYRKEKQIIMKFRKQTLFEGLYLPSDIDIVLPGENTTAEIKIKNFILNETIKDNVFEPLEGNKTE
ncbi:MAG: tetratricopeptide repeat protein [Endomicrobiales bacterium]|nr:tetratricopeptide repeat protein [Endomicrobiales bacterium]